MCVLPLQIRLSGNGALEENGCAHLPPAEHPQAGPHGAPWLLRFSQAGFECEKCQRL